LRRARQIPLRGFPPYTELVGHLLHGEAGDTVQDECGADARGKLREEALQMLDALWADRQGMGVGDGDGDGAGLRIIGRRRKS